MHKREMFSDQNDLGGLSQNFTGTRHKDAVEIRN